MSRITMSCVSSPTTLTIFSNKSTLLTINKKIIIFQDEYKDEQEKTPTKSKDDIENQPSNSNEKEEPGTSSDLINTKPELPATGNNDISSDLAGLSLDCGDMPANFGNFMPSQLLEVSNLLIHICNIQESLEI